MCSIDWCSFTWQAFATLITGFAAVGGATFVGVRQHGLAKEQARIADRQATTATTAAHVAKLKLRADLFEKRMEVYLAVQEYLRAALSTNQDKIWDATPNLNRQLIRAQFLFPSIITAEIELAITESDELYDARIEKNEARVAGEDVTSKINALRPLRNKLRDRLKGLASTLGDEMKLYHEQAVNDE